ncbi:secondary thiamine-phosphate synthase enzyme YjbQ [Desulfuribacillus alkaliarsenatis]|uniref:Secondary thiamine-phosphate synthase enzyme n=1 Tax=Desulfuribacillus alkaliarsenatis TaxID=766136 RepID=A0A1E5G764_9FIRM|nr:secondary thiamine-phosphate synthase enzyme YjbQ [Desulfuribacillus alkaliarsenatis]OEF98584.1 hypothetical protein BHF68_02670 [Desulfuribacillus alkaliarsenatis]
MIFEISIKSKYQSDFIDITSRIQKMLADSNVLSGVCVIYVPHTTAGITINENADPDVVSDMVEYFNQNVPWNNNYKHMEGNSAAHIKASILGSSVTVIIDNGKLKLGTWQGIYFAEFDGPRSRKIFVKVV